MLSFSWMVFFRDLLETQLDFGGYPVNICDTAGLRNETSDPIEREGILRAIAAAKKADLVKQVSLSMKKCRDWVELFNQVPENVIRSWGIDKMPKNITYRLYGAFMGLSHPLLELGFWAMREDNFWGTWVLVGILKLHDLNVFILHPMLSPTLYNNCLDLALLITPLRSQGIAYLSLPLFQAEQSGILYAIIYFSYCMEQF